MIMRHIDRSRATGGGMAASFVVHGGLLLLFTLLLGQRAILIEQGGELTEIAYIEARYGEDVAAKVQLKERSRARPEPPGHGVNTDSAIKPPQKGNPESPRPEPAARSRAPEVEVAAPDIAPKTQQQTLPQAAQLAVRTPRPQARQVIAPSQLSGTLHQAKTIEADAPRAATKKTQDTFQPQGTTLRSRSGTVALGEETVAPGGGTESRGGVIEAPSGASAGGSLQPTGQTPFQGSRAALVPGAGQGSGAAGAGKGVLDVSGPSGDGGGQKSGRKTILNYGSGGGGGGGGLAGRARIVEPSTDSGSIAEKATSQPAQQVAEVSLDGKGVNMTISGQIKGRKILKSVLPVYTAQARKHGWEGIVAVHFTVLADGRVKDNLYFDQTSVHRDLNQAAMQAIRQFRFAPLPKEQAAVEQWGVITIVFRLN